MNLRELWSDLDIGEVTLQLLKEYLAKQSGRLKPGNSSSLCSCCPMIIESELKSLLYFYENAEHLIGLPYVPAIQSFLTAESGLVIQKSDKDFSLSLFCIRFTILFHESTSTGVWGSLSISSRKIN